MLFKRVHPSPDYADGRSRRGTRINSNAVTSGRNNESEADWPDKAYVRCKQCGFVCNTHRDSRMGRGDGITQAAVNSSEAVAATPGSAYGLLLAITQEQAAIDAVLDYYEPVVQSGCPFCGSYNFEDR